MQYQIAASILSADFAYLADDVQAVLAAGAHTIHFDVMDHHYVPNLSVGPMVCRALRAAKISAPIDVHLMVEQPQQYIEPFAQAGADIISFHPETVSDVAATVKLIKSAGVKAGVVFNPDQEVHLAPDLIETVDMILLMSVFPGFGGQSFIPDVLAKITQTRQWLDTVSEPVTLAVDGGIKVDNIGEVAAAGADYFVVGSGLFKADCYEKRMQALLQALAH